MEQRRLATILSIDVAGYSRMMQSDSAAALKALNAVFRGIVKPRLDRAGGRIVKLVGDGAVVEFASARAALIAARDIQAEMRVSGESGTPVALRMGLHAGDLIVTGDDVFGDGVNIAVRLQAEAEPGGVLVSRTVADLAGRDLPLRMRGEGPRSLRHIAQPIETLSIVLESEAGEPRTSAADRPVEVRFCTAPDGQRLAWTAIGEGAPIVKAPAWISHLELDRQSPTLAHPIASLSTRRRVICFDARGGGLSDWAMPDISFETMVSDLECVFDAAGVERAPIFAISQGCAIAAAFAARAPERVSAIVMIGGFPLGRARRDSAQDRERAAAMQAMMRAGWDDEPPSLRDLLADLIIPGASREERRRFAEIMRRMISPENIARYRAVLDDIDVTGLLANVSAPCLVMHCRGDRMHPVDQGRILAAGLPNARFIELESDNHVLPASDPCWPVAEREMHAFLAAYG